MRLNTATTAKDAFMIACEVTATGRYRGLKLTNKQRLKLNHNHPKEYLAGARMGLAAKKRLAEGSK